MALSWYQLVVDARDLPSLARFWCQVLDWQVLFETEDEIVVGAAPDALPGICFVPVGGRKTSKNRLHIDLTPDDQAAEVERLLALGARRVDVGQGQDVTWVVLADPEGNEFCVLRPKRTLLD
ncbi:VOC family protein [Streptomyces fructofermentans]|uniref:Lactoylglutathione lyase n=1 Tax=Streptomyces fructofermentans TaxID=152141 RepID=A0A918KUI3_9ACTN|nr:VOC family protein [Streptomyces fructofermentans]GGX74803.1 lactoylglutathione lyase [Streptomyces fructofermentans]